MIPHRLLLRIALSASQAFAWVFVFYLALGRTADIGAAFVSAALLYALAQVATTLLAPLSARFLGDGVVRMMGYGVLALVAGLVAWGAAFSGFAGAYADAALILGALLIGAFRALYTTPFVLMRPPGRKASAATESAVAVAPMLAGLALAYLYLSPSQLLFASAGLAIASLAWLPRLPEQYERFAWGYRETFGELIEPRERARVASAFGRGVEGAALFFVWPIAIFIVLGPGPRSLALLGIILTLLLAALALVQWASRAMRARSGASRMPLSHGSVAVSAWALRLVASEPFTMALVNAYGALGSPPAEGEWEGLENATYLDERTALTGITTALGRLFCALLAALAVRIFPLFAALIAVFALAGLAAGASAYARHTRA